MTNEELSIKLTEVDQRGQSNTHRIDKLEKITDAIYSLANSVSIVVTKQDELCKKVDKLDSKVSALEGIPGSRWNGLVEKLIWAIAGALVVFLLAKIGVT